MAAVGTGYVQVVPSLKGFHQRVRRELASQRISDTVEMKPELDTKAVRSEAAKAARDMSQDVTFTAEADTATARRELSVLSRSRNTVVTAAARVAGAAAQLTGLTRPRNASVTAEAHTAGAASQLARLGRPRQAPVTARVDMAGALARLAALTRPRSATVTAHADTAMAATRLGIVARTRQAIINVGANIAAAAARIAWVARPRSATLNVDADTGMAQAKIAGLTAQLIALNLFSGGASRGMLIFTAVMLLAAPAVAAVGTALLGVPGALMAILGPVAAVALGFQGIKQAAQVMVPALDALKARLSATFAAGLTPVFQRIADVLLPGVAAGLDHIARGLVSNAAAITGVVTSARGMGLIQAILANIGMLLERLNPFLGGLTDGFLQLAAVGSAALIRFSDILNGWGVAFAQTMQRLSDTGILAVAFDNLGRVVGAVLTLFLRLMEVGAQMMAGPLGRELGDAFNMLGDAIIRLMPFFEAVSRVMLALIMVVLPPLLDLLDFITPALNWMADVLGGLSPGWAYLVGVLLIATAVIITLAIAVGALMIALAPISLTTFLVIAAIVALVAIIWILAANWSTVWDWITSVFQAFAGWFMDNWYLFTGLLFGTWGALIGFIGQIWEALWPWVVSVFTGFMAWIGGLWTGFVEFLSGIWNWMTATIGWAWSGLWAWVSNIWNGFAAWIGAVWAGFTAWLSALWHGFTAAIGWAWSGLWAWVSDIWNGFAAWIGAVWAGFTAWLSSIWSGFTAGIGWIWSGLWAWVSGVWNGFTAWLGAVWNGFTAWLSGVWAGFTNFIGWVWSGLWGWVSDVWNGFTAWLGAVWNGFTAWLSGVWAGFTGFIGAVWQGLWNFVSDIWNGFTAWLGAVWNGFTAWLSAIWSGFTGFVGAVWQGLWNFVSDVWNGFVAFLSATWRSLADWFMASWRTVTDVLSAVWSGFTGFVGRIWEGLLNGIRAVWHNVLRPTFDAIKAAVHAVGEAFSRAVDWIGRVWNTIRGILARPVNFVIDFVYNRGIVDTWNKIAGWLKIPGLAPMGRIPENKRGGVLPGYTPGRDTGLSWVSGGEAIMRPEWARAVGSGYVNQANRAARSRGVSGVQALLTGQEQTGKPVSRGKRRRMPDMKEHGGYMLPAFAAGGHTWPALWKIAKEMFSGAIKTSDFRPGDSGFHGRGQALDFVTRNMVGDSRALAGRFPMSNEIIHTPGANIKNGKPFTYSAGTRAGHWDHIHWASAGDPGGGGGGMFGFDAKQMVIDWFKEQMKPVSDRGPELTNKFGNAAPMEGMAKIPGMAVTEGVNWLGRLASEAIQAIFDSIIDWIIEKFGGLFGGGGGGAGVQRWRGLGELALRMTGQNPGLVDLLLMQMNSESGGDPGSANLWDSNAAKGTPSIGLMQVIGPTFDAYKMPGFGNIAAPLDNILASIRYTLARYGSLAAGWKGSGYDSGGWLPPGYNLTYNGTGKPEAILTAEQWDTMANAADTGSDGATITVNYADPDIDPGRVAAAIDRRLAMSSRV